MWITYALMGIVALLHTYFMVLEMFLWTKPETARAFGMTPELAAATATLASNMGLYNLFLAAGLVFAVAHRNSDLFTAVATFFLGCIVVAGLFGAATVGHRILFAQALPAALALGALYAGI